MGKKRAAKAGEETKLQIVEKIAPKKFMAYGIPVHKQFMARVDAYLEEDTDFDQVALVYTASHLGRGWSKWNQSNDGCYQRFRVTFSLH